MATGVYISRDGVGGTTMITTHTHTTTSTPFFPSSFPITRDETEVVRRTWAHNDITNDTCSYNGQYARP